MFTQHALARMQQRGISHQAVELLLNYGRASYHRGMEILFFDRQAKKALQDLSAQSGCLWEKIRDNYLVLKNGTVITVGHKHVHFKRDRH